MMESFLYWLSMALFVAAGAAGAPWGSLAVVLAVALSIQHWRTR